MEGAAQGGLTGAFVIRESHDLDHYRAQPGNWNVRVNQLTAGHFHSRVRCIQFPDLILYHNHWDCASMIHGTAPDGWLMFGSVVAPERAGCHWCGQSKDHRQFAVGPQGSDIEFLMDAGAGSVVVLLSSDLADRELTAETVYALQHRRHLDTHGSGTPFVALALDLLAGFEQRPQLLQRPAIARQARASLLDALEDCVRQAVAAHEPRTPAREEAVRQAIAVVRDRNGATTARALATSVGVSQKSLERGFHTVLGTTPGRFLVAYRLNLAHQALAEAREVGGSVTNVALHFGFSHLGRFSRAYRELFGELPSNTLYG